MVFPPKGTQHNHRDHPIFRDRLYTRLLSLNGSKRLMIDNDQTVGNGAGLIDLPGFVAMESPTIERDLDEIDRPKSQQKPNNTQNTAEALKEVCFCLLTCSLYCE